MQSITYPLTDRAFTDSLFLTACPVEDCRAISIAMHVICVSLMACASFLFLRRLHAVYANDRMVRWIFTFLWVGMTACGIPTLVGFHMEHIPGTGFCTIVKIEKYVSITDFYPAVFDTLVYFTVSYRIMTAHNVAHEGTTWKAVITGKALPRGLLRALFQGGQQYYLSVYSLWMKRCSLTLICPECTSELWS